MFKPEKIEELRKAYPAGTKVVIDHMDDNYNPVPAGTKGVVKFVDDAGSIHVNWENGSTLAIIPETDRFHVISSVIDIFTSRSRR